jgi:hypothetical protein
MGRAEFLIRIPAQYRSFVLYLIRNAIVGSLPPGLVTNAGVALLLDVPDDRRSDNFNNAAACSWLIALSIAWRITYNRFDSFWLIVILSSSAIMPSNYWGGSIA